MTRRLRTTRAVLLLFAAGTALAACSSHPSAPRGKPSLRVVYRVEDSARVPVTTSTVVLELALPYRGRTRTLAGSPPGTTDLGGIASDESAQYLLGPTGPRTVQQIPPGFPVGGGHLDVALVSAGRHHLITRSGRGEVAGRPCTTWLSHDPLDSGPLAPAAASDRTTSCVGDDGLLLQDSWTLHGKVVRTRTAVAIGEGGSLAGTGLLSGRAPAPAPTTRALDQVKVVSRSVLLKALAIAEPLAPQGLSPDKQAAVIRLDPDGQVGVEGGVLTWTDGTRLVVLRLERGLTHRLLPPARGVPVQVGSKTARLIPTSYGLQLTLGAGEFVVTVSTDLSEDALLTWATSLRLA